jgi:hypothetical protein
MILYDEFYFDISASGEQAELKKFFDFLLSGELDDFFEFSPEYINIDESFYDEDPTFSLTISISNEDWGIEIDKLYTDEFLELICKAGRRIHLNGTLSDSDGNEYAFVSKENDSYYTNARLIHETEDEDEDEDEEYEE